MLNDKRSRERKKLTDTMQEKFMQKITRVRRTSFIKEFKRKKCHRKAKGRSYLAKRDGRGDCATLRC